MRERSGSAQDGEMRMDQRRGRSREEDGCQMLRVGWLLYISEAVGPRCCGKRFEMSGRRVEAHGDVPLYSRRGWRRGKRSGRVALEPLSLFAVRRAYVGATVLADGL